MSDRLTKELIINAFEQAVNQRELSPEMLFHSDRGSQFACTEFQEILEKHNIGIYDPG